MSNFTYPNTKLLIGGDWRASEGGWIEVVDPATEEIIGRVAKATRDDLDASLAAAEAAFPGWAAKSPFERGKIMRSAAALLRERCDRIAWLLTREQGKPLNQARLEVLAGADIIDWFAEEARRTYGQVIPSRELGVVQMTVKLPIGPVAAFTPWNFPINQAVRKLSAALAAGCTIIIKAPEETPASPAELIRAFADAGVPAGAMNLIYGAPADISEYLIPHPTIRKVSFTGSTTVGKHLAGLAGRHMKPVTMELGGHAPAIVFSDADIDKAVQILAASKYRNAGQVCVSPTRFLVQDSVYEKVLHGFTEAAKAVRVGNGLGADVQMGPLANERRITALEALIQDALEQGAQLKTGGRRIGNKGYFLEPTVLSDVPLSARIMNEEPFGPIAVFRRFEKREEAIEEANRLPLGLASYAFTRSAETAHELSFGIEAGMTTINHIGIGLPEVPFGGIKDSGYGTEGGSQAIEAYLVTKFVTQVAA